MVTFSVRNTNIYKICKLREAIFSVFYNFCQPNLAILLILRYSFELWWHILFFMHKSSIGLTCKLSIRSQWYVVDVLDVCNLIATSLNSVNHHNLQKEKIVPKITAKIAGLSRLLLSIGGNAIKLTMIAFTTSLPLVVFWIPWFVFRIPWLVFWIPWLVFWIMDMLLAMTMLVLLTIIWIVFWIIIGIFFNVVAAKKKMDHGLMISFYQFRDHWWKGNKPLRSVQALFQWRSNLKFNRI